VAGATHAGLFLFMADNILFHARDDRWRAEYNEMMLEQGWFFFVYSVISLRALCNSLPA